MLTRREFHKSLAALALSSIATVPARAAGAQATLTDRQFLDRLSFGATPESLADLENLGRDAWLAEQLSMPAEDAGLSGRLATAELWIEYEAGETENGVAWEAKAEARPLTWLDKPPEELIKLTDWELPLDYSERIRPFDEVVAASFIRAAHAPAQLRELMTQFWHDHFNVYGDKDELVSVLFPPFDAALREHALGNFRVLLGEVAHAPAMLHYLNNDNSRASPANENYARELLELHTLGREHYYNDLYDSWHQVPGAKNGRAEGYIDSDVYEVARAFTGWTIGDGRWLEDNKDAPLTGRFHYEESWHDPYQKRVLGRELPAFSGPEEDGEAVLDLLAAHPGTAAFVSRKIMRRLGLEAPSETYLKAVAKVFLDTSDAPDQIAQVITAIVQHPEFSATPPSKLRRPFEYLIALYRATGANVSPRGGEIEWQLQTTGWTQHRVRPPTGHSDATQDWANTRTINGMIELVINAHSEWLNITDRELDYLPPGVKTMQDLAGHWESRFGLAQASLANAMDLLGASPQDQAPDDPDGVSWANEILVTSAALGPEFLFR